MKKGYLLIFALLISVSCMAKGFSFYYEGVEFNGNIKDGVAVIKSFNNKATDVTIPSIIRYNGLEYPVQTVSVFMNGVNYLTENLILEEGIEEIDKFCFAEFRKLNSVNLPSTLRRIGKNAFRQNDYLSFTMPSSFDERAIRVGQEVRLDGSGEKRSFASVLTKQIKEVENKIKPQQNDFAKAGKNKELKSTKPAVSKGGLSDVDMGIPVVSTDRNKNTYCIIIANEKYSDVPEVEFAERDGNVFQEYCIKTLGIPEKQIKTYINASYTDIKRAMTWLETMAEISEGESKILVYYAGHGIPNEKDKTAYLIPTDGFPKDVSTCFKLSELYARLGKMKSQGVTVLLDACFSGVKRGSGDALIAARGVAVKPKDEVLPANMIVFTATSDDETALAYQEKRHGMFTYFLLDNLKRSQGNVSLGDLFKSVSTEVKKNSMLENDKLQSPSINVSTNLKQKWDKMKF